MKLKQDFKADQTLGDSRAYSHHDLSTKAEVPMKCKMDRIRRMNEASSQLVFKFKKIMVACNCFITIKDHPKGHISNGDDLIGGKVSSKNAEIPEQPRKPQTIQKLIKSQKRESSKWREGTEDEKSWRQQLLNQRLGHSEQPTSRTKYYGEIIYSNMILS